MKDAYYWLDTNYHYGDFSVPKFALYRGYRNGDGRKDRSTEEVILWGEWYDVELEGGEWYDGVDSLIEEELGFLPEYEIG